MSGEPTNSYEVLQASKGFQATGSTPQIFILQKKEICMYFEFLRRTSELL